MSIFNAVTQAICEKLQSDGMSEGEFFEAEIAKWLRSDERGLMIDGERYYRGNHDILKAERKAIGRDGRLRRVDNLPNNTLVDNMYQKMVNQKVNYLLGREVIFKCESEDYGELLRRSLGKGFMKMLRSLMRDAVNMGISWLYVYTDEKGELKFKKIPAYEIIPYWSDSEHTVLDKAVRVYEVEGYKGKSECVRRMVEIYSSDKVEVFELEDGRLIKEDVFYNYREGKIPLIAFKYNEKEIPLIERVKTLQDALNRTLSDFQNNLQEDARNSILVLKNYDGTDLGEFRQNLASYGAVKVRSIDGVEGDIKVLNTDFNSGSYREIISIIKGSIVKNAMGCEPDMEKMSQSPNQLAIKSMFNDLDLDVCEIEVEFTYSLDTVIGFINEYLKNAGYGYFEEEDVKIVFNRDCIINESEAIENCVKSREILSDETILLMHPWVDDVNKEKMRREVK